MSLLGFSGPLADPAEAVRVLKSPLGYKRCPARTARPNPGRALSFRAAMFYLVPMRFAEDQPGSLAIRAYGAGEFQVGERLFRQHLVVTPERVLTDWAPASFAALEPAHMERLAELDIEILLLGTGDRLCFPAPALLAPLQRRGIAVEVMDTPAACRTFNLLLAEDRPVAAVLFLT